MQENDQQASGTTQDRTPQSSGDVSVPVPETTTQIPPTQETSAEVNIPPAPQVPPPPPPIPQEPGTEAKTELPTKPTEPVVPPSDVPTVSEKPKKPIFKIVIITLVIITLIIWGFVAYSYFRNKSLEKDLEKGETALVQTPTPTEAPPQFSIENGNIIKIDSQGESSLIVSKENYEDTGIIGFTNVLLSPNYQKLCFWSLPPALKPALYYSNADGGSVSKVRERAKNCLWSTDNNMIAYIDDTAQDSPANIYIYNLGTGEETNLTEVSTPSAIYRRYSAESWLDDEKSISCSYDEINTASPEAITKGSCKIDTLSGEVADLQ